MFTLYHTVTGKEMETDHSSTENPYLSISYYQYNLRQIAANGFYSVKSTDADAITDPDKGGDYPDGSIRYAASQEEESAERLLKVQQTTGACTYQNCDQMTDVGETKRSDYEALIDYLLDNRFIDYMHLDRTGNSIVWNYGKE